MVVSLLIFGILMSTVVAVLHPATRIFIQMQKLQYAQVILDNTIQELRGRVLEASGSGYVKIYETCGLDSAGGDKATDITEEPAGKGADRGGALEFINLEEYCVRLSADGFPETHIYVGETEIDQAERIEAGRLLVHYYARYSGNSYLYRENTAGGGGANYIARAVTTVFADGNHKSGALEPVSGYYMGNYLKLEFSYPAPDQTVTDADGTEHTYYSYLYVTVSLYDDPAREPENLVVQDFAVLDFRYPIERFDEVTALVKPESATP